MTPSPDLQFLLNPSSVAIVGASERAGSVGDLVYRQLVDGGFGGKVHPVNPGYASIHGATAYPSIGELPEAPDLTVLAVANDKLEEQLAKSIEAGTKAAVIFASCHGTASDGGPLKDRLRDLANDAGVPICGGNGMGFLNIEDRVRICGFFQPELDPGGVAFISHSGSLFSAMLHNRRHLGFNLVVSSGLELNTTMDRYIKWALDRESTRVIALFLETVRNPDGFSSALSRASDMGIPVVVLKVGESFRGKAAVTTHSEALAGEETTFQAVFDQFGVHMVNSPDELLDTIEIFNSPRRATAYGLGAVHDSGGERAMLIDIAHRVGVTLPDLSPTTTSRLEGFLDPGLEAANPVDAWGTGRNAEGVFANSLGVLADDDSVGAVAFCVDLTAEERPDDAYSSAAIQTLSLTDKPVVVIANLASAVDPIQARQLRSAGIPVLEGTETALRALSHLFDDWLYRKRPSESERLSDPQPLPSHALTEMSGLHFLSGYGIEAAVSTIASSVDEAVGAAGAIGYPVVIKTAGVTHKSDVDGVTLNVVDESGLRAVVADFQSRLGNRVTIARQIASGVEVSLGMYTDLQFGPVILLGAGGVLVEYFDDHVAMIPPVDKTRAREAIDRLRIRPLLDGTRGKAASDVDRLAEAVARFSELVVDHHREIASIDVNPLIVGQSSVVAVDALIERR